MVVRIEIFRWGALQYTQTLSDCFYEEMFIKFLEKNNYQCLNATEETIATIKDTVEYDALKKQAISAKINQYP